MKDLHEYLIQLIDADSKAPIILVEQYLDDITLRWALSKSNITFPSGGTSVYYARTFHFDNYEMAIDGQMDALSIEFDNVDGYFDAYLEAYDFQRRTISVKRIYRSGESEVIPADPTMYNEIFFGEMEQPQAKDETIMSFPANAGDTIDPPVLNKYYGSFCQHRFGDNECSIDLRSSDYYTSGEANGGSTSMLKSLALNQDSGTWKYGMVNITHDGTKYRRKIKNHSANATSGEVHLDIAVPVTIASGDLFTIEKGCDFSWVTCAANNEWGPETDNTTNFIGFIHIGINRED